MSKRLTDRERLLHKFQQMTDNEVKDILDYVSRMEPTTQRQAKRDVSGNLKTGTGSVHSDDELLALLSAAYENRRALQVFEWETARRRAEMKVGSVARR
ncbi:MAG: hypothetical protein ABI977_14210 [Acidobacteriota bacterium]